MRFLLLLTALLACLTLAISCDDNGGDSEETPVAPTVDVTSLQPVRGNSELVVGPNRFAIGLIDENGQSYIPTEDATVRLQFSYVSDLIFQHEATFVYAIPNETGFFVANVDFPGAGSGWSVTPILTAGGQTTALASLNFPVVEQSSVPNIGGDAIPVENLTSTSEPNMSRLTTDEDPNPAFYEKTVAQALQEGRPMVITFATPAFCQTAFCGPILDNVKAVQPEFAEAADFIHIEPYELDAEGNLVMSPDNLPVISPPMQAWMLQTEPWIYVVDSDGRITARFEGAASQEELREAISAATAPA
jgi:hypothetical protein